MKPKFYHYPPCSTCKKAKSYLDSAGVAYESIDIVKQPPTKSELIAVLEKNGGAIKKLFNTSGEMYREMKLSDKIDDMTTDEALDLLTSHGKLIKRPLLVGGGTDLAGFKEAEWSSAFDAAFPRLNG